MVTVWQVFSVVTETFTTVNDRWLAFTLSTGKWFEGCFHGSKDGMHLIGP